MSKPDLSDKMSAMLMGIDPEVVAGLAGVFGGALSEPKPLSSSVNPEKAVEKNAAPALSSLGDLFS